MLTQERPAVKKAATLDDRYQVPGKAEWVNGKILLMRPTGSKPSRAATRVYVSLNLYEQVGIGYAYPDNVGFIVNSPGRRSFSPNAAWFTGDDADVESINYLPGAPAFIVEVRSDGDYGPKEDRGIVDKIAHYFRFRAGNIADCEPAVPGGRLPVNEILAALICSRRT